MMKVKSIKWNADAGAVLKIVDALKTVNQKTLKTFLSL
jgi:hypothetical protein